MRARALLLGLVLLGCTSFGANVSTPSPEGGVPNEGDAAPGAFDAGDAPTDDFDAGGATCSRVKASLAHAPAGWEPKNSADGSRLGYADGALSVVVERV